MLGDVIDERSDVNPELLCERQQFRLGHSADDVQTLDVPFDLGMRAQLPSQLVAGKNGEAEFLVDVFGTDRDLDQRARGAGKGRPCRLAALCQILP